MDDDDTEIEMLMSHILNLPAVRERPRRRSQKPRSLVLIKVAAGCSLPVSSHRQGIKDCTCNPRS
jgi:hypothetical protein